MGLLDQLWDDTLAGPQPDSGLGKLRKHKTFSFRSSSATGSSDGGSVRSLGGNSPEEAKITRSIMIVKPPGYGSANGGSAPVSPAGVSSPISPAGSTPPVSPFSGSHSGGFEGGQRRMHTRRRARSLEEGAPVLLATCDI